MQKSGMTVIVKMRLKSGIAHIETIVNTVKQSGNVSKENEHLRKRGSITILKSLSLK